VARRDESRRQVSPIEGFRIPADRDDRFVEIAFGQLMHFGAQMFLRSVRLIALICSVRMVLVGSSGERPRTVS
jgi:hypothetical protein